MNPRIIRPQKYNPLLQQMNNPKTKYFTYMIKFLLKGFGYLVLFYLFILGTYGFWLPWFGEFLIVNNQLKKSDLIVVSTGSHMRVQYAIELMEKGIAPRVLLLGDTRYKISIVDKTTLELAEREMLDDGVSREKLIAMHSTSTQDDARIARDLMTTLNVKSALVISDKYNMRRLAAIFNHVFRNTAFDLGYVYAGQDNIGSTRERWWEKQSSFIYVMSEWIKFPLNIALLRMGKA